MTASAGNPSREAVAIVGIGCRLPGGVDGPGSFWRLLAEGRDAIGEVPSDRFDLARFFAETPATPGRTMTRWGGFVDSIDSFDADFFGMAPREAERLDPQQRLLLETAWEALEDAGIRPESLDASTGGVFVGQWLSDFEGRLFHDPEVVDFYMTTGSGRYASSGRLSYVLGMRGPSLTLDTACSSSLTAVHLALRSIREGECDFALAGGVNVILQPHISIAYSQSRMMAPDGRCKFGDARGDGYVRSEGAVLVALKPLRRALTDGDRVYAVLRGSAINNDGHSSGSMGTPSRVGQAELLRAAHRDAGCAPSELGYVEAHGTGTRAGDPVELGALADVLGAGRDDSDPLWVGSVKTNIGHTEGAAGIAGLVKAALALHHQTIPASLHCREPNPTVPWRQIPVRIARDAQPWPRGPRPRLAGVSAFGIAGSNAHVVLEEAPVTRPAGAAASTAGRPTVLLLSARRPEALRALARSHAEALSSSAPAASLDDWCWSAATRRAHLEHRSAFVTADAASLVAALRNYADGEPAASVDSARSVSRPPRLVFVCPGQGAQWFGMGRVLLEREPVFRAALERCDAAARRYSDVSLVALLRDPSQHHAATLERIDCVQPLLVAMAIAYAELWRSWGLAPDAVVGHSMGEVAAAHVAGVLDTPQAMRIICRRSALMRSRSGLGAMAMVDLPIDAARALLVGQETRLAVAVSNSPRSCVLSGDPQALHELLARLEKDGVFCRLVKVDVASHSPQMDGPAAELRAELADLVPSAGVVPILSTVLGREAQGHEFDAAYWARNLRDPVRFSECTETLLRAGPTCFIELGPHPILSTAIQQTAQGHDVAVQAIACGRRDEDDTGAMLAAASNLWAHGVHIAWTRVLPAARSVALPTYPWQRERHWVREARPVERQPSHRRASTPPETLEWIHALHWRPGSTSVASAAPLSGEWLVVADDDADAAPLRALLADRGAVVSIATFRTLPENLEESLRRGATRGIVCLAASAPHARSLPVTCVQALHAALAAHPVATPPRLWCVTNGAQPVEGHDRARVAVDAGAVWGAGRVVAEEHPQLWGGLVDLDPNDRDGSLTLLAQMLGSGHHEPQVAIRGGRAHVLRLEPLDPARVPAAIDWRADCAYLVTGGLGAIGLHVAAAMVRGGARRLVLLGRSGLPPRARWAEGGFDATTLRRIAAVRELEAAGASVHLLHADCADAADLQRALKDYEAEAWPPIRGVVHAAGLTDNHLALHLDASAFDRVVGPKLDGALHLDRLLPTLDCFVMFSSISALLGSAGMANYAAANAGLDALAADRRARGLHGLSIQWGAWEDTGLFSGDAARGNLDELRRQGVKGFSPAQGVDLFEALAGLDQASLTVMPIDWPTLRSARRGRSLALYGERAIGDAAGSDDGRSLSERLVAASPLERRRLIEPVVRDAVARVLKLAPARIDAQKALGAMGLSSLMAMELRNRLEAALARPLSATLAWNYPSIDALVGHLSGDGVPVAREAVPAKETMVDVAALAELSDDDAARLLRRRR